MATAKATQQNTSTLKLIPTLSLSQLVRDNNISDLLKTDAKFCFEAVKPVGLAWLDD